MRVESIRLRVYVEGILLPDTLWGTFSYSCSTRGVPTASLSIAAIPGFRAEEWARAMVFVCWSDAKIREETDDWPMLWSGEISGFSFRKTPYSREVDFDLIGELIYWKQCKLYYYNVNKNPFNQPSTGGLTIEQQKMKVFFGNSEFSVSSNIAGATTSNRLIETMRDSLTSKTLINPVKRFAKDCMSSNAFFRLANERIKLDERFALVNDKNISIMYGDRNIFFTQMEGNVSSSSADTPMLDVIERALAHLRYHITVNPQPKFIDTKKIDEINKSVDFDRVKSNIDVSCVQRTGKTLDDLGITQNTTDAKIDDIARNDVDDIVVRAISAPETLTEDERNILTSVDTTDEIVNEANDKSIASIASFLKKSRDELRDASSPPRTASSGAIEDKDEDMSPDSISQFLMLPDMDFALPPQCNVIYPDSSAVYAVSRDFINEPTRLAASVPVVTDSIRRIFIAPEFVLDARVPEERIGKNNGRGNGPRYPLPIPPHDKTIGSKFGLRRSPKKTPDGEAFQQHRGQDIKCSEGTSVYACEDGKVIVASFDERGGGKFIKIKHEGFISSYLHLSKIGAVVGQDVKAGQEIGKSGNTGNSSTGPHLHFEIIKDKGNRENPLPYLNKAIENERKIRDNQPIDNSATTAGGTVASEVIESDQPFDEFLYLTPEEEVKGIVPIIDVNMDRVTASFAGDQYDLFMKNYAQSAFSIERFAARPGTPLSLPWSPWIAVGFPALIVDPIRSYIATVTNIRCTYSHAGGGSASTIINLSSGRFWDEGDPYAWKNGEPKFIEKDGIQTFPDPEHGLFPPAFFPDLVPVNSYESAPEDGKDKFGGNNLGKRKIDAVYRSILGVDAIPYYASKRINEETGASVVFNGAVDGYTSNGSRIDSTIVGKYEASHTAGTNLTSSYTESQSKRLGMSQSQYMTDFLGAEGNSGGYYGNQFRQKIRLAVEEYIENGSSIRAFRG